MRNTVYNLTNLKNPFQNNHAFGHILLKNTTKNRARKWPKIVAPSPLASDAAGSSVAVSNDNDVGYLYLPDPEISDAGDLS
jgi:hypothetical protein